MPDAPPLEYACTLTVDLGAIRELGPGRSGQRRIVPIVGGRVAGPLLNGTILNLGADWQTIQADGAAHLDTRYAFETADGALIEIVNVGTRHGPAPVIKALARGDDVDPDSYYMRTAARLETGDPRYAWVNNTIFVGRGERTASSVMMHLFAVR